ncbi:toprim domain-containing protein [Candidatus Merdisoma sp. JLR.KK006]|uniref:toprim domain-containing protein n=1 Tax=Candidatus Merdisoma sp. JLR.KK006 TaxID=3112626 RepID=UPI002FF07B90
MGFEFKEELKQLLPDYLELLEEQGKVESRGEGYYVCPFCNSGDKKNYTAAFHIDGTRYNCFACSKHGDIFDLVAHMENLPSDWKKHYNRTLKIMRPCLDGDKPTKSREEYIPEFTIPVDYTEYLYKCHKNVGQTDYFSKRGLSKKTIERFKLGYDSEKNLVTIPYNPNCKGYVDRVLWDGNSKYYKHGNELFNIEVLYEKSLFGNEEYVFITEGQIDAMSFEEIGLSAIGLGGVNEVSKLVQNLNEKPSNKVLVLALDNDKAGRRAIGKFIEELAETELEQDFIVDSGMYKKYKDANEFLIADRDGFIERMKRIAD